jgi:Glycoside hydrolase family 44
VLSRRQLLTGGLVAAVGAVGLAGLTHRDQVRRLGRNALVQPVAWAQTAAPSGHVVQITIDPTPLRPISPMIYGVSVATPRQLLATQARVNRWGGNPNTRYNWVDGDAWNAARDWEFRNYGSHPAAPRGLSRAADEFVANNQAAGAASWITVPALGWVARDGDPARASSGVPAGGGPPLSSGSDAIDGYDPGSNRTLTSVRSVARNPHPDDGAPSSHPVYQDDWVRHLLNKFGTGAAGGVRLYAIDNEPDLWSVTHTDVHPVEPDYDDMLSVFIEYASAIKDVDPTALVTGPGLSGWTSLFYSARDRGRDRFRTHADRAAHGGVPFIEWWLNRVREEEGQQGRGLLDVFDVHYYPQATGVYGRAGSDAIQRTRLRSTRSLWDPGYVDESWIADTVQLIPRMRAWRDQFAPGTAIGIGEWNWGADDTMNGALAIANVLGIFGREGVDLACYWTSPDAGTPGAQAFALYTNYDGQGGTFGDQALAARSSAPDDVAVYASRDTASGDLLLVLLNQRPDAAIETQSGLPPGLSASRARWYTLQSGDPVQIREIDEFDATSGQIVLHLPPESASLLRIAA